MKLLISLLGILAIMVGISCTKETEPVDESTFGYDFIPVTKGKSWIYVSDSIIYDNGGTKIDTFVSFIKEEIGILL